ncbi:hypothetical protein HMPREF0971_02762 [Segatella oris F0302]|uniref:Fimbrillin family protein n=1 Tax=Segatella oris F0302 TaxID=649760 RepID=D1QUS7_9BACT|nr:hypothetical protein [Segatella oris]EFB30875.1 hypothetical protein HMPREF0971_02762 [Segatella oris F0302]
MKKNTILSIMTCAAMLLFMAACSNDENSNGQEKLIQAVQFSFTNEDFGADEILSRATGAAETKPQTVDLGDCEAEISVENEPAVKTRGAQTNADGHYTIRAYQGGTLKGEMKGTFSGGAFTPDGSSRKSMNLSDGTYDFIAFNDDVVPSGNELTVARDKAATAMIGTTTELINQHPNQKVMFTMKHVGCRLRTQFICKKHIPNAITATLEPTGANVIPVNTAYNLATKAYTSTNGAMTAESNNSPASTEEIYTASEYGKNYSYISASDYHYFLPTTEGSKLKLSSISAGTVFWKPIPTFNIPNLNATLQMQAGKSYAVKIKLKPNYTYLMSDGTTGHFKDTTFGGAPAATAKTPIAVVVDKDNHMAIALNEANGGAKMFWCINTHWFKQNNTHNVTNIRNALNIEATSGYDETWDASYTTSAVTGEKVKGKNPDFLTFKAAADYNPGVSYTGSPALKWYLPSFSDFKWMFSTLGFGDKTAVIKNRDYKWYGNLAAVAFTQVGGTAMVTPTYYWSSTEYTSIACCVAPTLWTMNWSSASRNYDFPVLPFVKY